MKGYHGLERASTLKEQIVAGVLATCIVFTFNYFCVHGSTSF
jgi:hypothetical protein